MTNDPFAGLPAPLRRALERRGFETLTLVQQAVADARADGRDLRISSQTGSGKTVAIGIALADHFLGADAGQPSSEPSEPSDASDALDGAQVEPAAADAPPAVEPPAEPSPRPPSGPRRERGGQRTADGRAHPTAIVIVPTRELAAQVREELAWLYDEVGGVRVEVVTGGTSVMGERRALARGPQLVVGTPGRLLDHIQNDALDPADVAHVVLDEADQMLDMGFKDELDAIVETLPKERSSHLVSATFPRLVRDLANRFQRDPLVLEGTQLGVANADIQHIGYAIQRHETYAALVNILLTAEGERCLLFVNTRADATALAEKLAGDGFGAAPMSGELAQAQRTRTLNAFRNGSLPILVSTEVAARGIDVPGISTVIHVDPPREADAYTHRSGRTGRAGETGRSILLVTPPNLSRVERMLRYAKIDLSWQPVPTPEKVAKARKKRDRRKLHAMLAEHAPDEAQMMYAKSLLEERDPIHVVATLLDLTKGESAREPMPVTGFDPTKSRGSRGNERSGRGGDARGSRGDRGPRDRDRRPGPRRDEDDYTRFFVAWGAESGATASRLLSQLCRRGGITSDQVGAIQVAARVSFVAIANDVVPEFEAKVREPDERDRGIVIKRAEDRPGQPRRESRGAGPGAGRHRPARDGRSDRRFDRERGRRDERRDRGGFDAPRGDGPPSGPRGQGGGPRGPKARTDRRDEASAGPRHRPGRAEPRGRYGKRPPSGPRKPARS